MEQRRRGAYEDVGKETKRSSIKKSKGIFFKVIAAIFTVMTGIFFGYLVKLNMLPNTYLIVIVIALFVLTALCVWGLVKRGGKALKICITIFLVIVMGVYVFAINYINSTITFIDTVTEEVKETEDYYVVTLKTSKYSSMEMLNEKNLHLFVAGEDYTDVKQDILKKATVYFKEDESLQELTEDLLANKTYAILVSKSQYEMLKEDYEKFESETRIIYTVTHKISNAVVEEPVKENTSEKFTINSGNFNVYISGIDTSGRISNVARSDANIIVSVNTNTHEILLTSIPRDYYVTLHSKHAKDKLTHAGVYGIKETYTTVEDLLDTDINYYVRVNFTTVIKLVNALGGVDVNSEYAFSSMGYSFKKGYNHLNGEKALVFSRERYSFNGGDNQRIRNQQAVITAIMNKALSSSTILTKYTSILESLSSSFQTNISTSEINSIVKGQINNLSGWTINTQTLSGAGASMGTYTYGTQKLYVMIPNSSSVQSAIQKINDVLEVK